MKSPSASTTSLLGRAWGDCSGWNCKVPGRARLASNEINDELLQLNHSRH
jgi:hypothetical protein